MYKKTVQTEKGSPQNLKSLNVVQASQNVFLHLLHIGCFCCCAIAEFGSTQVLFYEIQFTVKLGIKVTDMSTRRYVLLEL